MKSNELNVCHKQLPTWWLIEQVCSPTKECRVYQFVPDISISRQFVSILFTILQLIQVPLLQIDGHPCMVLRLCITALSFGSPVRNISQRIFEHVLPYRRTTQTSLREFFPHPGNFSVATAEIRDSNIFMYSSIIISFGSHSRWVHPKYTWSRNVVGSSRSTFFINFFHTEPSFPQETSKWIYRGRGIHKSEHSDFRILSNLGTSSILTWVYAGTASAACPSQSGRLAMTSITFAVVIGDADEPCSVKTALAPESSCTVSPSEHDSSFILLKLWL